MPGGDRRGPVGMGPMTGRAAGYCGRYDLPGYANGLPGRGFGMGFGGGRAGRGFRGRAFGGGGFRRWNMAPGFAGGITFRGYGAGYVEPDPQLERSALSRQANALQAELEAIRKRIDEIEGDPAT